MFKKGYKVILIKDGQFDLKEFHVNPLIISFITIIIIVPLFTLFFYINSFYNSNMNDLIDSQTQKIKNLESKNKLQSDKLDNYEFTIEKNINDNRQSLKSLNNQLKENQKRSDKIVKVLFDTKGLSDETRKVGSGGVDSIKSDKPLDNSSIPDLSLTLINTLDIGRRDKLSFSSTLRFRYYLEAVSGALRITLLKDKL